MNFYEACSAGNLELVKKYLYEGQDPSSNDNYAIRLASEYGHTDVVKFLLSDPRVDPSSRDNYAIRWASRYGHTEVLKLLSRDVRVISSLKTELKMYVSEEEYNTIISENEEFFI